jgi:hypothetical protein
MAVSLRPRHAWQKRRQPKLPFLVTCCPNWLDEIEKRETVEVAGSFFKHGNKLRVDATLGCRG